MAELFQEAGLPGRRPERRAGRPRGGGRAPRPPGRRRGLVRRLDAGGAPRLRDRDAERQARAGARRARRTTPWSCPTPTSPSPRTRSSAPPTARRASAAWRSRRSSRWARRAIRSSRPSRERAAKLPVGPGHGARASRWGRSSRPRTATGSWASSTRGSRRARRLVVDGRKLRVPEGGKGFFVGPTLFDRVTPAMSIYREEIFGPVLVVLRAETLDEAIDVVNRNPYGNGTAIFTRSGAAAQRFARDVQVGMVGVNVADPGADGVLLLRRLEAVALRRPARPRARGDRVLHAHARSSPRAGPRATRSRASTFAMPTHG